MALLVPNVGEGELLGRALNEATPDNCVLKLYQSNTTPAEADVVGTYTEATFTGYSSATLTGASWTVTEGAPTYAQYAQQAFTSSAGSQNQDIYGYYVTNNAGTILLWAERFTNGPYNIANNGDEIRVTPYIELA